MHGKYVSVILYSMAPIALAAVLRFVDEEE